MKKIAFLIVLIIVVCSFSFTERSKLQNETQVLIRTNFGDITVQLYENTPEHKANFLKLASEGFYDSLLFHRVIEKFMIQGGDPNSIEQPKKEVPDYTIAAEFVPGNYHKRGALAAARQGDQLNPQKRSSASQFYIVQGERLTNGRLDTLVNYRNLNLQREILNNQVQLYSNELNQMRMQNDSAGFTQIVAEVQHRADSIYNEADKYVITEEQREVYTTIGGYPPLDGEYTVFGEVVKGMDVVDKIAVVETDGADKPVEDVVIIEMEVLD